MQDNQTLSIIALGEKNDIFLKEFSQLLSLHSCEILQSQVSLHDSLYSVSFHLLGKWSVLAKLEPKLKLLAQKFSYDLSLKFSPKKNKEDKEAQKTAFLPYSLYIVSLANTVGFYQLIRHLCLKQAKIAGLTIDTYQPKNNSVTMTTITIKIQLPTDIAIADWRESFMLFCDDYNLDAIMEPDKGN